MKGVLGNAVRWGFAHQVTAARSDVDGYKRERDDFYPTPPAATEGLLSVESFEGSIWEPACGDGAIAKVLESAGHSVVCSDLIDRGYGEKGIDFLMEWKSRAPNVVTNPPFRLGVEFTRKALQLAERKVAILHKLAFLEGQERKALFTEFPPARVWVFSRRLPFVAGSQHAQQRGGGLLPFAWFIWEIGFTGKPTLGWL